MNVNSYQVGGSHYKTTEGVPQHWDLAIMYQWDPFQYQITKYVMRWKDKHPTPEQKLVDLKKAQHFLEKYISEYEKYLRKPTMEVSGVRPPQMVGGLPPEVLSRLPEDVQRGVLLSEYEFANPRFINDEHFLCEGGWGDGKNLYTCLKCREKIVTSSGLSGAHEAHAGHCPTTPTK